MVNKAKFNSDDILKSMDGMKQVSVNPKLWNHLIEKIETSTKENAYVSSKTIWYIAASVAFLVLANTYAWKTKAYIGIPYKNAMQNLVQEYGLNSDNESIYNY